MPLKIKIMEVGEEEEIVAKDFEDYETAEWDGIWDEDREEEDDGIFLTDFTVDIVIW